MAKAVRSDRANDKDKSERADDEGAARLQHFVQGPEGAGRHITDTLDSPSNKIVLPTQIQAKAIELLAVNPACNQ